jgi:hypothetical protein
MKISLYPEPDQIAALLNNDPGGPVVMVNLLKFKAAARAKSACIARPVSTVSG